MCSKTASAADPSSRYEWFQFQYDTVFNPHAVYHMEIKWLVATGMHLESWLKNLMRKAETRFGKQIVKIPTNQPLKTADSFHVPVPLHINNPHVIRAMEEFIIGQCGFVMDSELQGSDTTTPTNARANERGTQRTLGASFHPSFVHSCCRTLTLIARVAFSIVCYVVSGCRQYVHESGMCALRKLPSGLVWINNHLPSATQHRKASVILFTKIKKVTEQHNERAQGPAHETALTLFLSLLFSCVLCDFSTLNACFRCAVWYRLSSQT